MGNLKRGKLLIRTKDLLGYMGLTNDTSLNVKMTTDGIEIDVIASSENNKEWLVDNKNELMVLRRSLVPLNKYVPVTSKSAEFKLYREDGSSAIIEDCTQDAAVQTFNSLKADDGWIALVKEEVIGYKK